MCHNVHEYEMFKIEKLKELDGLRCPRCGQPAESRRGGRCICIYCGYEGDRV